MAEADEEVPLVGGNVNQVVRVGQTVRRPVGAWSTTVHDLLLYLERQGFEGAPHFKGLDEQGREILSYIEGEVGHYPLQPYMWHDETLVRVAAFLRRFHDLTANYKPPAQAQWQMIYPDSNRHEVICHNDFAPYNLIFRDERPYALFDFDMAGPGPRLWDMAYVVYRFVPLSWAEEVKESGLLNLAAQRHRLSLFCEAYGLAPSERTKLIPMVVERLEQMVTTLLQGASNGNQVYQKMIDEGHAAHYRRELVSLAEHRQELSTFR